MAIINGIIVETIEIMVKNKVLLPFLKAVNIDGEEEQNKIPINKYKSRVTLLYPKFM
jgi:uncharacterized phosphosugar-binding protein